MLSDKSKLRYSSDELFFKELYKENYLKSVYYANKYINDYELSKELVQDAFMILWDKRKELNMEQNIVAYLFTMVRNRCFNTIRNKLQRSKNYYSEQSIDLIINQKVLTDDSASKVLSDDLGCLIKKTLQIMPEKIRSVFVMSRDEELTYPKIASILGISQKTVEYRMTKALALFRVALKDYLPCLFLFFLY